MSEGAERYGLSAEIEAQAALWLEHRHLGRWDDEMQSTLDGWLSQSSAHVIAYWRLDAAWNKAERLIVVTPSRQKDAHEKKALFGFLHMGIGAAVVTIAVLTALYFRNPPIATYATTLGEFKTITLSDGSKIELNTDSVLRLSQGRIRTAWLDKGEAYFQIKHNAADQLCSFCGDGGWIQDRDLRNRIRYVAATNGWKFLFFRAAHGWKLPASRT